MKAVITIEYEFNAEAYFIEDADCPITTEKEAVIADLALLKDEGGTAFLEWLRWEEVKHTASFDVSA